MTYFAITQASAEWLLPKVGLLDSLHSALSNWEVLSNSLKDHDFIEGPIRISYDSMEDTVFLWHVDYISGSSEESWGFVKCKGELSIFEQSSFSREVLERSLYIINQRLQGLLIDGAYYHRKWDNGAHTLLAGRGTAARNFSLVYFERFTQELDARARTLIILGPHKNFPTLIEEAEKDSHKLPSLFSAANKILNSTRNKPLASAEFLQNFRINLLSFTDTSQSHEYDNYQIQVANASFTTYDSIASIGKSYENWLSPNSSLSEVQRRILLSESIDKHPLRILGPAGSGKTLLMQLLAIKKVIGDVEKKALFIVHSEAMRNKTVQKLELLYEGIQNRIFVTTLSEYCRKQLHLDVTSVIEPDVSDAKQFQLEQVKEALKESKEKLQKTVQKSPFLETVFENENLLHIFSSLVLAEISIAIKGHGLEAEKKKYVESERALSRLHANLDIDEREFIYETFQNYHRVVFETYNVLDPDDIALSLAARLRTPVWQLRRKTEGFDYVFVDEAQLFNENERRVFALLTKGDTNHAPIALALDEAQALYGQSNAGLATLGIKDITNENLSSIQRSTPSIIQLAFFIIQRSTDLFGVDFPDFTGIAENLESDNHPLALKPKIDRVNAEARSIGKYVRKSVGELRRTNIRQIAVICHAEQYWETLLSELSITDLPFQVIHERGERIPSDQPIVVLSTPEQIGGQEFDAVILVGLEQGIYPPRIVDNEALNTAIEQKAIREMYLSITRAKYRVLIILSNNSTPNPIIQQAINCGLVDI